MTKVKLLNNKKIASLLLATSLTITSLSGCGKEYKIEEIEVEDIKIDEENKNYTYVVWGNNYNDWLYEEESIEKLNIVVYSDKLHDARFPSLKKVSIQIDSFPYNFSRSDWDAMRTNSKVFNEENFGFLKSSKNLETIYFIDKCEVDFDFLTSFDSVKNLKFFDASSMGHPDYSKLVYLDKLTISGNVYDTAIFMTKKDIVTLQEACVELDFDVDKVLEVNELINQYMDKLYEEAPILKDKDIYANYKLNYVLEDLKKKEDVALCNTDKEYEFSYFDSSLLRSLVEPRGQNYFGNRNLLAAILNRLGIYTYMPIESYDELIVIIDGDLYIVDAAKYTMTNVGHLLQGFEVQEPSSKTIKLEYPKN